MQLLVVPSPLTVLLTSSLGSPRAGPATARPEGVNRPELLPKGAVTSVIDVAGFLAPSEVRQRACASSAAAPTMRRAAPALALLDTQTHFMPPPSALLSHPLVFPSPLPSLCPSPRQEAVIAREVESLERDTGFRLRVLAQNYPETPGERNTCASLATWLREGRARGGKNGMTSVVLLLSRPFLLSFPLVATDVPAA